MHVAISVGVLVGLYMLCTCCVHVVYRQFVSTTCLPVCKLCLRCKCDVMGGMVDVNVM